MRQYIFTILISLAFANSTFSQTTLFVPRNYLKPYERGTRSWDGKPGPNYWQNRASYKINASIEPKTRRLSGEETVTYFNNSPDTLRTIRFKLQHDRYRKGAQRGSDVPASDVSDEGTRIEQITLNGQPVDAKNQSRNATFLDISIKNNALAPKSSATFTLQWSIIYIKLYKLKSLL